ncbi:MAG: hypothetical protein OEV41_12720 [Gammaproteobacteria bacterium]|nr:hypothetical protein [Gammaproteobacteria bacterium]MDH5345527.1 hypothetical protein [Gammaproteobacteria bacterium]
MSVTTSRKVLVRRPSRATAGDRGRAAWTDPAESAELELVSTQMLKVILSSRDNTERKAIARAARTSTDGVLARHPASGRFEIIEDDELKAILDENRGLPKISRPDDATLVPLRDYADDSELSLVSTHALRRALDDDEGVAEPEEFNPYDYG